MNSINMGPTGSLEPIPEQPRNSRLGLNTAQAGPRSTFTGVGASRKQIGN